MGPGGWDPQARGGWWEGGWGRWQVWGVLPILWAFEDPQLRGEACRLCLWKES